MSQKNEILGRLDEGKHYCVCIWSEEDVIGIAQEMGVTLTPDDVIEILNDMERHHDAEYGVTWSTIRHYVSEHQREAKKF